MTLLAIPAAIMAALPSTHGHAHRHGAPAQPGSTSSTSATDSSNGLSGSLGSIGQLPTGASSGLFGNLLQQLQAQAPASPTSSSAAINQAVGSQVNVKV
jgi:hypothetical protein